LVLPPEVMSVEQSGKPMLLAVSYLISRPSDRPTGGALLSWLSRVTGSACNRSQPFDTSSMATGSTSSVSS
jgi:hypothetical protein